MNSIQDNIYTKITKPHYDRMVERGYIANKEVGDRAARQLAKKAPYVFLLAALFAVVVGTILRSA